jgi:flagellar biosynthesis component FlhA
MWIISFLPEWVFHLIFGLGILGVIASFFLGMIPVIKQYKLPLQIISILTLMLGVYLQGGLADYKEWEAKVKEMEAKIAVAEEQAKGKNVEIQEKVVTQTKVVREKGKDIVKYIDRYNDREVLKEIPGPERVRVEEVIKYVEKCPIPKEIVDIHNQAATLNKSATKPEGEKK